VSTSPLRRQVSRAGCSNIVDGWRGGAIGSNFFIQVWQTQTIHNTQPQRAVTQDSEDMPILSRRTATTRYQI